MNSCIYDFIVTLSGFIHLRPRFAMKEVQLFMPAWE